MRACFVSGESIDVRFVLADVLRRCTLVPQAGDLMSGAGVPFVPDYQFTPEDRPLISGSPFSPCHPLPRRICYAMIAVLLGITSTMGNALVTVNIPNLAGELGLYVYQASLLPAIYVAMNACSNLVMVKSRIQFGIPATVRTFLILYVCMSLLQFVVPTYAAAIIQRAASGLMAGTLTSLTIYYIFQVIPRRKPIAIVLGISIGQFGLPIARLIPVDLLAMHHWQGLHLIELTLVLSSLAATTLLPLPPVERGKSFERLDFVTIALMVPAMLLLCSVLSVGRVLWWTDTPWLGVGLALSIPLFTAAMVVERHRANPLIHVEWIGTRTIFRAAAIALLVRTALAEQTYGSVGFLTAGGLDNDQLHLLFLFVLISMVLGALTAAVTFAPERIPFQVIAASLLIALGAWYDSNSTSLTRPEQLYWSQSLLGFGTTLFIGPALGYLALQMLKRGGSHLVSFVVLFSITQNVGSLVGSAFLGSVQFVSERIHATALAGNLSAGDPQIVARVQYGTAALSGVLVDPALRSAEGAALLGKAFQNEVNTLAFNDVFRVVMWMALLTALYLTYVVVITVIRERRGAPASV